MVAGRGAARGDPAGLARWPTAAGWPVLADALAFPRLPVAGSSRLGRAPSRAGRRSVRCGRKWSSTSAPRRRAAPWSWQAASLAPRASHVLVDPFGRFGDPGRVAGVVLRAVPGRCAAVPPDALAGSGERPAGWLDAWDSAEAAAQLAIDEVLGGSGELTEPGVARRLVADVPAHSRLVVSSSMPIRDVDAYARPREGAPTVFANRGANGIDGVVSTVLGVAASGVSAGKSRGTGRSFGLLGDLAFFHDLSALVRGAHEAAVDATVVVVDNAGGGIFSFLPYAPDLETGLFERALAAPQSPDLAAVGTALGCRVHQAASPAEFSVVLADAGAGRGVQLVVVRGPKRGERRGPRRVWRAPSSAAVDRRPRERPRQPWALEAPRVGGGVARDDRVGLGGALDGADEPFEVRGRERAGHLLGRHAGPDPGQGAADARRREALLLGDRDDVALGLAADEEAGDRVGQHHQLAAVHAAGGRRRAGPPAGCRRAAHR